MPKNTRPPLTYQQWLQESSVRIGRALFALTGGYIGIIILYDAFNLITPDMLLGRWIAASALLVTTAVLWYAARSVHKSEKYYAWLIYAYVVATIAFASFNVYMQRGVASKSVFLFVIPVLIAAFLLRRAAIFMAATIATAAYSLTAIWYSIDNPSESYKATIYGEIVFYSILLFIAAALIWGAIRSKNSDGS